MSDFLEVSELAPLILRSEFAIREGMRRGVLVPAVPGEKGRSHGAKVSLVQALLLVLAKSLAKRGVGRKGMARFTEKAWNGKPQERLKAFKAGNTHLLVVGKNVLPVLVNPRTPLDAELGAMALMNGLPAYHIDVQATWRRMLDRLAMIRNGDALPVPTPSAN